MLSVDPDWVLGYGRIIAYGALVTIEITVLSCIVALVSAFAAGLMLRAKSALITVPVRIWVEILRGTSVFVQLFWVYFVLPIFGLEFSALQAGVIVIGLNGGAYGAEIVRSAIQAVGLAHRETCIALNLSAWQSFSRVILPLAMPVMLPSLGNLSIEIMKGTAAASLISLTDMTFEAQVVRVQTGMTLYPFLCILGGYFLIATLLAWLVRGLESYFRRGLDGKVG